MESRLVNKNEIRHPSPPKTKQMQTSDLFWKTVMGLGVMRRLNAETRSWMSIPVFAVWCFESYNLCTLQPRDLFHR